MKNQYEERLGTDRMLPLVFRMALPAVAAQFVNLLYNIVDRIYIGHIPVGLFTAATQDALIDGRVVLVVLYLGFFGSGVAQFTWVKCLSALPASTCSLFYPLQPVFSALLGAVILGETFTSAFFIGLVLISIDVALSTWETNKLSAKP